MRRLFPLLFLVVACGEPTTLIDAPEPVRPDAGPPPDVGLPPCSDDFCYPYDRETAGVGICTPGVWRRAVEGGECVCTAQGPTEETCDGVDNDCDGDRDEGFESVGCLDVLFLVDASGSMNGAEEVAVNRAITEWSSANQSALRVVLYFPDDNEEQYRWLVSEIPDMSWRNCARWVVLFSDERPTGAMQHEVLIVLAQYDVRLLIYTTGDHVAEYAALDETVRLLGDIDLNDDLYAFCPD